MRSLVTLLFVVALGITVGCGETVPMADPPAPSATAPATDPPAAD